MRKTAARHNSFHSLFHVRFHASYIVWFAVFLFSFLIQVTDSASTWRFDREQVAHGHIWLLVTGHFAHMNWSHWAMNMAGLAIVAVFFSRHCRAIEWLAVLIVSIVVINIGIWFWVPDIESYVGLSGVLHGLFIYGALREIRYYPLSGYVLTTILIAKLIYESIYGALPGSEEMAGGRVLTQAHLLGAIGGALVWVTVWLGSWLGNLFSGRHN